MLYSIRFEENALEARIIVLTARGNNTAVIDERLKITSALTLVAPTRKPIVVVYDGVMCMAMRDFSVFFHPDKVEAEITFSLYTQINFTETLKSLDVNT